MADSTERSPKSWSYSMELLSHVHTLRLFLIQPSLQPSAHCLHLTAALSSPPLSLSCSWTSPDGSPFHILLPLPLLLFDHSAAPRVLAHVDHIELSIQLLSLSPSQLDAFSSLAIADEQGEGWEDRSGFATNVSPRDEDLQGPSLHGDATFFCRNCATEVSKNAMRDFVQLPRAEWREVVEHWFGTCCCSFGSRAEFLSAIYEKSLNISLGRCLVGSSTFYIDLQDVNADAVVELHSFNNSAEGKEKHSNFKFLALGNGFMVWANEQNKSTEWVPAHCAGCLSLLGAYPRKKEGSGYAVEGIHLFKSQISTFKENGDCHDPYRYAQVEKFLVNELQSRTEENGTHRFLIRSLTSKLPLLQLVVLSYKASVCTGSCMEIAVDGGLETAEGCKTHAKGKDVQNCNGSKEAFGVLQDNNCLKSTIKVMFLDCSCFTADRTRSPELWAQEHDADTVYVFEELAKTTSKKLLANSLFFPASCGSLQNFKVSFLYV